MVMMRGLGYIILESLQGLKFKLGIQNKISYWAGVKFKYDLGDKHLTHFEKIQVETVCYSDGNYDKDMAVVSNSWFRTVLSAQPGFQILKGLSLIHIRDGHANLFQMIPRAHVNDDTITTAGWWWCTLGEVSYFSDQN